MHSIPLDAELTQGHQSRSGKLPVSKVKESVSMQINIIKNGKRGDTLETSK
jgi:hypothetical protein